MVAQLRVYEVVSVRIVAREGDEEAFATAERGYYDDPARADLDPDPASLLVSVATRLMSPVARGGAGHASSGGGG